MHAATRLGQTPSHCDWPPPSWPDARAPVEAPVADRPAETGVLDAQRTVRHHRLPRLRTVKDRIVTSAYWGIRLDPFFQARRRTRSVEGAGFGTRQLEPSSIVSWPRPIRCCVATGSHAFRQLGRVKGDDDDERDQRQWGRARMKYSHRSILVHTLRRRGCQPPVESG